MHINKTKYLIRNLKFCDGLLLDAENDDVGATHSDGRAALLDRFLCILNLTNTTVNHELLQIKIIDRWIIIH